MKFTMLRERIMTAMRHAQELPSPGHLPEHVCQIKQQLDTLEHQMQTLMHELEHMERIIIRERTDEYGMKRAKEPERVA
jgi:hypothetical protein